MMLVPYMGQKTDNSPATPIGGKMISLDHEMEEILNNRTLTESEKVTKYTEAMQKFMEYQKQYTLPSVQVTPLATTGDMGETNNTEFEEKIKITPAESETPDKVIGITHEPKPIDITQALSPSKPTPKVRAKMGKREYFFSNPWLNCE